MLCPVPSNANTVKLISSFLVNLWFKFSCVFSCFEILLLIFSITYVMTVISARLRPPLFLVNLRCNQSSLKFKLSYSRIGFLRLWFFIFNKTLIPIAFLNSLCKLHPLCSGHHLSRCRLCRFSLKSIFLLDSYPF